MKIDLMSEIFIIGVNNWMIRILLAFRIIFDKNIISFIKILIDSILDLLKFNIIKHAYINCKFKK